MKGLKWEKTFMRSARTARSSQLVLLTVFDSIHRHTKASDKAIEKCFGFSQSHKKSAPPHTFAIVRASKSFNNNAGPVTSRQSFFISVQWAVGVELSLPFFSVVRAHRPSTSRRKMFRQRIKMEKKWRLRKIETMRLEYISADISAQMHIDLPR